MFSKVFFRAISLCCLLGGAIALESNVQMAPKAAPIEAPAAAPADRDNNLLRVRELQNGSLGEGATCNDLCGEDECAPGLLCKGQGICTCGISCTGKKGTCQPPTTRPPSSSGGCFSASASVQTTSRGRVAMKDLEVGDRVLTTDNKYEEIYAFGHKNPTAQETFVQIHTTQTINNPLELTESHLLRVNGTFVKAASVEAGDELLTREGIPARVTRIQSVHRRDGVYAPLTPSGTLLVDDMVASAYVSLQDRGNEYPVFVGGRSVPVSQHFGIHMALSPYRMLCMGLKLEGLCQWKTEDGINGYVKAGMQVAKYADTLSWGMQLALMVTAIVLIVPFFLLEAVFGARWAALVLFGAGVLAIQWRKKQQCSKCKNP